MFVRVRSNVPGDPLHEFDVPVSGVKPVHKVVDPVPVSAARPASYRRGVVKAPKPKPADK